MTIVNVSRANIFMECYGNQCIANIKSASIITQRIFSFLMVNISFSFWLSVIRIMVLTGQICFLYFLDYLSSYKSGRLLLLLTMFLYVGTISDMFIHN